MTKQDILQYVMNTPYNTNPAVLASLLDGLDSGEGIEEIVFNTIEYDEEGESLDFNVVTSDTLSTTEYQLITAEYEEEFYVSGILLPKVSNQQYLIANEMIFLVEQTENGYAFTAQGSLNIEDIYSSFSNAYHEKINELGGQDAEQEIGNDFWDAATEDGAQTDPTTITEANYKMWTWMDRLSGINDIIRIFSLTDEQGAEVGQILQNGGTYYDALAKAALLTNTTLPGGK